MRAITLTEAQQINGATLHIDGVCVNVSSAGISAASYSILEAENQKLFDGRVTLAESYYNMFAAGVSLKEVIAYDNNLYNANPVPCR